MTDDLAAFLDAAEARAAAATPDCVEGDPSGQTGWGYYNIPDGNAELCAPDGSGYRETTVAAWFECDDCGGGARLSQEDADFIIGARSDLPALVGMVRAVLALHKPWRIYGECEHSHDEDDPARVDCGDFTSCEASFMYEVCAECCQENGYMTEHCADCHDHGPDKPRCPTLGAIPPTPTAEETR